MAIAPMMFNEIETRVARREKNTAVKRERPPVCLLGLEFDDDDALTLPAERFKESH